MIAGAGTGVVSTAASPRVCVIGAGPSGLAAAKNCLQAGLCVDVFEKSDRVGGNWAFDAATGHSSVFENTYSISSRAWSEFEDFPMPRGTPEYPHHRQLQAYFERYAEHFGVLPRIRFGQTVDHVARAADGDWRVRWTDERGNAHTEIFTHLMVANGHHWDAKWPEYPGHFNGTLMHSHDFKRVDDSWRGKSVLVIGAGNSACDIAVETARVARKVSLSMRGPQWFLPKFLLGVPSDVMEARASWIPRRIRQWLLRRLLNMEQGCYADLGLPENTALPLEHHPTLNSHVLEFIRHGRILPRPAIARFDGDAVIFTDGRREAFDIIVACTGFSIRFPFFDPQFIDYSGAARVPLWRRMMHAEYPNLYFIGLFQPLGCIWTLADMQAKLACAEIGGRYRRPHDLRAEIAREMADPHVRAAGGRHSIEVDYHRFRGELAMELKKSGIHIGKAPAFRRHAGKSRALHLKRTADRDAPTQSPAGASERE